MIEYTLKLTREQAAMVDIAVELFLRLKLNQYEELPYMLTDLSRNDFCERRDKAIEYLRPAFEAMQSYKHPDKFKDETWHRLYNIHQVIRYQRHLAEFPNSKGVDSYPPVDFGGVGLPKCEWRETGDGNSANG